MKTKIDNSDKIYTVLICFFLLVIACVETFTSGILKKTEVKNATAITVQADLTLQK